MSTINIRINLNMFVCVLICCNKDTPKVIDVVEADAIVALATRLNSGNIPELSIDDPELAIMDGELHYDGSILLNNTTVSGLTIGFSLDRLSHKSSSSSKCSHDKQLICMFKEDRTINEIYDEIYETFVV